MADVEKTLRKMALVLDRVVHKVEEIDDRVRKLEHKMEVLEKNVKKSDAVSKSDSLPAAGSFLGSLAGVVAGLGLYHLLFDDTITPEDLAHQMGMEESGLESIEEKIEDIDNEIEDLLAHMDSIDDEEFEHMSLDDYLASEESFDDDEEV